MRKLVAVAAVVLALAACEPKPPNPHLKVEVGDGTWNAGEQIRSGPWRSGGGKDCRWSVAAEDDPKTPLAQGSGTGVQEVRVDAGKVLVTRGCGPWKYVRQ